MAKNFAQRHFARMAALNEDIDAGGHVGMAAGKSKRKLNDSWANRSQRSVKGFFNHKEARAAKRATL